MENLAAFILSSSILLAVDFDGADLGCAIVTWSDANDVEHVTTVEIVTERSGWGRRASFSCEVWGDVPLSIAHQVAEKAEDRAVNDYWGV